MTPETVEPVPPWELPGALRRDGLPHRGPILLTLAHIGRVLCIAGAAALVGLPLCVAVIALARSDLKAMSSGMMDRTGKEQTRRALTVAIGGIVLLSLLTVVGIFSLCFYALML